jgi:hypothetical protein
MGQVSEIQLLPSYTIQDLQEMRLQVVGGFKTWLKEMEWRVEDDLFPLVQFSVE